MNNLITCKYAENQELIAMLFSSFRAYILPLSKPNEWTSGAGVQWRCLSRRNSLHTWYSG